MKKFLDYACQKYYAGEPIMDDIDFDDLAATHNYQSVGHIQGIDAIEHPYQMYSLQKVYQGEEHPNLSAPVVTSPKLDGAAISIVYVNGDLTLALSRGDGIKGKDITENVKKLNIPKCIFYHHPIVQITGEVVAPKEIPNARNYAAGALGLKDPEEFAERDLTFIAYGLFPYFSGGWAEDMKCLLAHGFYTVIYKDWQQFPQDGLVFRTDKYEHFEREGYTSRHPRGAYALKERKEGVETTLLDVKWQVGKSGVVSPVAILEAVDIDGAQVSRATLHNSKYIKDLGLEIGCSVEVIRSGEIIPRVVRRVDGRT